MTERAEMARNRTTISKGSNGQYKVTIPQALAASFDLDGEKVEWSVENGNGKLSFEPVDE